LEKQNYLIFLFFKSDIKNYEDHKYQLKCKATFLGNEPQTRCPDISKARKKLGFKPKVNIDQSLDLFIKYYIS